MKRFAVVLSSLIIVIAVVASCDDESTNPVNEQPKADPIDLTRHGWYPASIPLDQNNDAKPTDSRVTAYWYNIEPGIGLHRRDLDPALDEQENTLLPSLDIELESEPAAIDPVAYAGVMQGFDGGLDISQREYIEIWINDFKPDPADRGGILHIDLGIIDENFHDPAASPAVFNDEDKDGDGFAAGVDDTGLDGLFNDDEVGSGDDPAGDDIDLNRINGRFSKVNGTEGNNRRDTEDLDGDGQFGRVNAYFAYEIDLGEAAVIDVRSQYPSYEGFSEAWHVNDSWRLYRVQLSNHIVRATGATQPSVDDIRHIRVWFDGLDQVVRSDDVGRLRIQIAEFSIVGSR